MNLTEIVNRSKTLNVHELEMNYVISYYIKELKGVNIKLTDSRDVKVAFNLSREMSKKLFAFETAIQYFLSR